MSEPCALHVAHPSQASVTGFLPKLGHHPSGLFSRCQCAAWLRSCWPIVEVASCSYRLFFQAFVSGIAPVRPCANCLPFPIGSFRTLASPGATFIRLHAKGDKKLREGSPLPSPSLGRNQFGYYGATAG
jgi:hypothetical protein